MACCPDDRDTILVKQTSLKARLNLQICLTSWHIMHGIVFPDAIMTIYVGLPTSTLSCAVLGATREMQVS